MQRLFTPAPIEIEALSLTYILTTRINVEAEPIGKVDEQFLLVV